MRSSWLVVVAACTDPPQAPLLEVHAIATKELRLDPQVSEPTVGGVRFRWDLVVRPEASTAEKPSITEEFTPDIRGVYLVEVWEVAALAEHIVSRIEVIAAGDPPTAQIAVAATVSRGASVTADGQGTVSPEHRPLLYRWRLASRPLGSTAMLMSVGDPTTTFVPDLVGDYGLELSAFDGELWSEKPATATISASDP